MPIKCLQLLHIPSYLNLPGNSIRTGLVCDQIKSFKMIAQNFFWNWNQSRILGRINISVVLQFESFLCALCLLLLSVQRMCNSRLLHTRRRNLTTSSHSLYHLQHSPPTFLGQHQEDRDKERVTRLCLRQAEARLPKGASFQSLCAAWWV